VREQRLSALSGLSRLFGTAPDHRLAGTELAELAGAAGLRWTIEECFQRAKEELGLDHCEARSWHGWNRHMTLCMAAGVFLAGLQATLRRTACGKPNRRRPALAA
jgi:SRSO17 transposase